MWSPVLTTGWHKQVLFTNQWAAQVHTVWLQPKILWDCKFSFLQHFLFFKRKPLNPILASNVVLSAVERTCLAWIAFPVERSRYKQVAHISYFLCLWSNECAKCEIPLPDHQVTETEEAAPTSFPVEISREHVVAISSPRLCLLRVGRCRSKRSFYWTGKVDRRRICSHHLSDGDTQVSIVMLSWIIFNSFSLLNKMNDLICRCCTPNTPTTDATWRWVLINSEEWMFDGTFDGRCFEKNSCGGLFVVHTNDTVTNVALGACAFLSKVGK